MTSKNNELSSNPLVVGLQLPAMEEEITPTENFFVRNHYSQPEIDINSWRLKISIDDKVITSLSYEDITSLNSTKFNSLLECAGNSRASIQPPVEGLLWDNSGVSSANWTGIPVSDILSELNLDEYLEVAFIGADSGINPSTKQNEFFGSSLTVEQAGNPQVILAYEMNEQPLTKDHGFPVRVLIPGWYGMASVKWLTEIKVMSNAYYGFHQSENYVYQHLGDLDSSSPERVTSMQVKSLITFPTRGTTITESSTSISGKAWSGTGEIEKVDVSTDGGQTWKPANLKENSDSRAWTSWEFPWNNPTPGYYVVQSRAQDSNGNFQPTKATWNFRGFGNNSIHSVPVRIKPD
jgi:DMSO/TMAO reductase YedYZ molybdopterin-dependent catalytic subunit